MIVIKNENYNHCSLRINTENANLSNPKLNNNDLNENNFNANNNDIFSIQISKNENSDILLNIFIDCDEFHFSYCDGNPFFSPAFENKNTDNEKCFNNSINDIINFTFPKIVYEYFFPSQNIHITLLNTFTLKNTSNIVGDLMDSEGNKINFSDNEVQINSFNYNNMNNNDEWFYLFNNSNKYIYFFKSYCLDFTKNDNYYYCNNLNLSCDEFKNNVSILGMNSKIKCSNGQNNYLYYYNYEKSVIAENNYEKCAIINHFYDNTLEHFIINIIENEAYTLYSHNNDQIDKIKCEKFLPICDKIQIKNITANNNLETLWCKYENNCDNNSFRENILSVISDWDRKDIEIHCNDNHIYLFRQYNNTFNCSNLENWEICPYLIYKYSGNKSYYHIDLNNNSTIFFENQGTGLMETQLCNHKYLKCCKTLQKNNNLNLNKPNYTCSIDSFNDLNSVRETFTNHNDIELFINLTNNSQFIYHSHDYYNSKPNMNWEICSEIYYLQNKSFKLFEISKKSTDSPNYNIYSINNKTSLPINACEIEELLKCQQELYFNSSSNPLSIYCKAELIFSNILTLFPIGKFRNYELIINCSNCGTKIVNYHNYDFITGFSYNWEICSVIIHSFNNALTFLIIERNESDFIIYDDSYHQLRDCEPYFTQCNKVIEKRTKYNKDYIYCESNNQCSTIINTLYNETLDHEIYCQENQETIVYFHKFDYYIQNVYNWEDWENCSYIYYNEHKYTHFIIKKENYKLNDTYVIYKGKLEVELDLFICNFPFLYHCSNKLTYNHDSNNKMIKCETNISPSDVVQYFIITEENTEFQVKCGSDSIIYYHYYNFYENPTELKYFEKCSYLLNKMNNEQTFFRIEQKNTNNEKKIEVFYNNQKLNKSICDSPFLVYCEYLNVGEKNNYLYAICNLSETNYTNFTKDFNGWKNGNPTKLEFYLHYKGRYSYYHIYEFSLDENNIPKWEACCIVLYLINETDNSKYFLINGSLDYYDNDSDFKIFSGQDYYKQGNNDLCFPIVKEKKYYGQLYKNISFYLSESLVEPLIPNFSGFGFNNTQNNEGKIYYVNTEISDPKISHLTYVFNYYHLDPNISEKKLEFILYFKRTEMIRGILNITIFPDFCESDISLFENNSCKIIKNDNDILKLLIENLDSPLLKNKTILGVNSQFNIYEENQMDRFDKECWSDIRHFYKENNASLIQINKTYQIIGYFVGIITKTIYDQFVCNDFKLLNHSNTINYNYIIDIKDLVEPSIKKLDNIPDDFFQISIHNNSILKGFIFNGDNKMSNDNNILKEGEKKYNLSKITYGIKYDYCFYNEKFEIQLYKRVNQQGNKARIELDIFPSFCKSILNKEICLTNKTKDEIFNTIHKHSNNISCLFQKVIREIGNNYIIQIYDLNNNTNIMLSRTISLEKECEATIRNKNSLSENDKIIILIYDNKKNKNFLYELYDEKGNKLDISECANYILINPIGNYAISSTKIKNVKNLGYDLFDSESPIYNDKCISLSINGNDVILEDRKSDIYNVVNPCLKECSYISFDEDTGISYCNCKINNNINNENEKENENENENEEMSEDDENKKTNNIISNFKNINIKPINCYKLLYNFDNYIDNYGFWIFSFFILCHIITLYSFYKYEFVSLKSKIYQIDNNKSSVDININNQFIHNKKNIMNSTISSSRQFSSIYKKRKEIENVHKHKQSFIIMNKFSFKIAMKNDKRPFIILFLDILTDKMLFLKAIYKKTPFNLRSLNISLFILSLSLVFVLNALFYTDKLISEKYHNDGLSLVTNILRSVLSSFISVFFFSIFNSLSDYLGKLYSLINGYNDNTIYTIVTYKFFSNLTRKFTIYFSLVLLCSVSFLYYITLFCSLYKNSQKIWIQGALTSILMSNLVEAFLCAIASIFRAVSFIKKSENLYNIYLFIYNKI